MSRACEGAADVVIVEKFGKSAQMRLWASGFFVWEQHCRCLRKGYRAVVGAGIRPETVGTGVGSIASHNRPLRVDMEGNRVDGLREIHGEELSIRAQISMGYPG